ncbi:patatin-like phospholipase family protein [Stenotrophomonas maltophilia]
MKEIGLVLSGGGIRAMVFHLGVLKCIADANALENVACISSVSGGSLIAGLVLQQSRMKWPSSRQFSEEVLPALRLRLTSRSLQWDALRELAHPCNWRYALSRSNLLAAALRHRWGVDQTLESLPQRPVWSINATNAENGRRFRFKRDDFGDYESGYAKAEQFSLAHAMAVSAAFPGGFGPLALQADRLEWRRRPWGAPESESVIVPPPAARLHLYDGGVYDNLGLEPFFDAGRGLAKIGDLHLVVSDAGMPLGRGFRHGPLSPFRLKRVADIMSDQSRALRVRTFQDYISKDSRRGVYLCISDHDGSRNGRNLRDLSARFPTTLKKVTLDEFDSIFAHGLSVAALKCHRNI